MAKSSTPHQGVWSAEEIGFLAGGPGRAAEAALARMMDGGVVRVSREGFVTAVHQNGYGATTPLEAYVLAGLQGTARPLHQVVQVAMNSREMGSLHQSLVARAMVRRQWGQPRGGISALRTLLVLLAIASAVAGIVLDARLFVLSLVLLFITFLLRKRGRLTALGRSVVRYVMRNPRGGPDVVAVRGLRQGRHRVTRSSSDGGGCGGGCGGSSCSGSSCSSSSCSSSSSSCSSSSSSSCSSSSGSSCSSSSS